MHTYAQVSFSSQINRSNVCMHMNSATAPDQSIHECMYSYAKTTITDFVSLNASKFTSRFSQYVFQALRSATHTSKLVSVMQYPHIVRSLLKVSDMEAYPEGVMHPMKSRRGIYAPVLACCTSQFSAACVDLHC